MRSFRATQSIYIYFIYTYIGHIRQLVAESSDQLQDASARRPFAMGTKTNETSVEYLMKNLCSKLYLGVTSFRRPDFHIELRLVVKKFYFFWFLLSYFGSNSRCLTRQTLPRKNRFPGGAFFCVFQASECFFVLLK